MSNWGNVRSEGGKAGHQGAGQSSSSSFSGPNFDNLYMQKRSMDQESIKRRESIQEQYNSGFIGRMWRRWVSGPGGETRT
ncbi:hypothetical protein F5Y04DRAFT_266108 [Hypomontagnella monticulosa]|nr:hypothetical protein F5Y04DRAFT_266108 [Hypomontagnella monticulosa]